MSEPTPMEDVAPAPDHPPHDMNVVEDEEEEEDVEDLLDWLHQAETSSKEEEAIVTLTKVMDSPKEGPKALQVKERAVYEMTRKYCAAKQFSAIVSFLQTSSFFEKVTKAKCAKVVRQVLDIVCTLAPTEYAMQEEICNAIIAWCQAEKRSFLRQRVQAKLAGVLYDQGKYAAGLEIIDALLVELKQLDDKQLLVETHLMESKIHFALRNVPKAKAALTASRTAANAIYVAPHLQAQIDTMSGTIHTEEADYNTAHSYFLEAFEQLDQMNEPKLAIVSLKYMMLCRILDALHKALGGSSTKVKGVILDLSTLVTNRQAVKYAGSDLDALTSIAKAASARSLHDLEAVLEKYPRELQDDLLIKHHLHILKEQLLESNLLRIMEPYSCVELDHVAHLMELPLATVERKLSQMILDGKFKGILDQGKGQLIIYEESDSDLAMEKGLAVLEHLDQVVTTLFERSKALRTPML